MAVPALPVLPRGSWSPAEPAVLPAAAAAVRDWGWSGGCAATAEGTPAVGSRRAGVASSGAPAVKAAAPCAPAAVSATKLAGHDDTSRFGTPPPLLSPLPAMLARAPASGGGCPKTGPRCNNCW